MGDISQFSNRADGIRAGQNLLALTQKIGSDFASRKAATQQQLDHIIARVRGLTICNRPSPAVEGFLSTILREEETDGSIITTLGAKSLIADQNASAPCCHLPENVPFLQFAYWTGDEDGDAWVLDFEYAAIRCLSVSFQTKQIVEARARSYGVVSYLDHFVALLRADAIRRGWIAE